ncbi:MAG: type II toxin-antitoxin system RelE/ParE family toxin [Ferruginibacter sp.]
MNSEFVIKTTGSFDKSVKKLLKKYPSFVQDLKQLRTVLLKNPVSGISLGNDCYKLRLRISSKNTGKSGGARVITYVKIEKKQITLLDIYDKADKDSISEKELAALIKKAES